MSRRSVSTFRGPISALRTGRGTAVPGPLSASSVTRILHPLPACSGSSSISTRASPAGQPLACSSI